MVPKEFIRVMMVALALNSIRRYLRTMTAITTSHSNASSAIDPTGHKALLFYTFIPPLTPTLMLKLKQL